MKKNIILTAVLSLLLNSLFAQESAKVNASATRSFGIEFPEATHAQWQPKEKGVSLVSFRLDDESWIAFYTIDGKLITSGRKVKSADMLPVKVKESLDDVQFKYETKYGALAVGSIFEMISDRGTQYFAPLENGQLKMLVSINGAGATDIQRKEVLKSSGLESKSVIARKN